MRPFYSENFAAIDVPEDYEPGRCIDCHDIATVGLLCRDCGDERDTRNRRIDELARVADDLRASVARIEEERRQSPKEGDCAYAYAYGALRAVIARAAKEIEMLKGAA